MEGTLRRAASLNSILPSVIRPTTLRLCSECDTRVQAIIRIGSGSSGEGLLVAGELTVAWVAPLPALQGVRIIPGNCGRCAESYSNRGRESDDQAHFNTSYWL